MALIYRLDLVDGQLVWANPDNPVDNEVPCGEPYIDQRDGKVMVSIYEDYGSTT